MLMSRLSAVVAISLAVSTSCSTIERSRRSYATEGSYGLENAYPPEFIDRSTLNDQASKPFAFVNAITSPTLGAPRPITAGSTFSILLDGSRIPSSNRRVRYWIAPQASQFAPLDIDELPDRTAGTSEVFRYCRQLLHPSRLTRFLTIHQQNGVAIELQQQSTLTPHLTELPNLEETRLKEAIAAQSHSIHKASTPPKPIVLTLSAPETLTASTLYSLFMTQGNGPEMQVVDSQFNCIYTESGSDSFRFLVAADFQWGRHESTASGVENFIRAVNAEAAGTDPPEFMIVAGDLVDGNLGSSSGFWDKLFGGGLDGNYPRDYAQLWLRLLTLKVPAHLVPGNHDGIHFGNYRERPVADGLLFFESTFGPPYHAFERGNFLFACMNSYDLPRWYRSAYKTSSSTLFEFSNKLNVLNWGGGLQLYQQGWIRRVLEESKKTPLLFLHHDPRGSYPAEETHPGGWTKRRHVPVSWSGATPKSNESQEYHAGYYVPLRDPHSSIRSNDWFGQTIPPAAAAYPGWIPFQQGWHLNKKYHPRSELGDGAIEHDWSPLLASPLELLEILAENKVRYLFKGHDNRFCTTNLQQSDTIIPKKVVAGLPSQTRHRLRLQASLAIRHLADIGDVDTAGHGYLSVRASDDKTELDITEHSLKSPSRTGNR